MSHSYNLNVFWLAVYGVRMKRPEFYISKAYSVILRELLLCQGVGEQKKMKFIMDNDNAAIIVLLLVRNHIFKHQQATKLCLAKDIVLDTFC